MANSGDYITKANFPTSWAVSYEDNTTKNSTTPEWYYISCSSFGVRCNVDYNLWSTPKQIITCWYYNWGTSTWTQLFYKNCVSYSTGQTLKFYHNYDGTLDASFNYVDTEESAKASLFKFRVERNTGNGSTKSWFRAWLGGAGTMTADNYNNYLKGKPIISNGILGSGSECFVWYGGRSSDAPDGTAISKFNPANNRGSLILATYAYNCVPKWY